MRTLVFVFFFTMIPFSPIKTAQASSDAITPFPVVVLEKKICITVFLKRGKTWLVGGNGANRYHWPLMVYRALVNIKSAEGNISEVAEEYVDLMLFELRWLVKSYRKNSPVGRLAKVSLDAFEAKRPSITTAQAGAFVRAQMGEVTALNGEEPRGHYFPELVRKNFVRYLNNPDDEIQNSALLYLQALMTESQLRLLDVYDLGGQVSKTERASLKEVWRRYEQIMAEE